MQSWQVEVDEKFILELEKFLFLGQGYLKKNNIGLFLKGIYSIFICTSQI